MTESFFREARLQSQVRDLQHDALILAMGLHGTNEASLPVEVCRVLEKYRVAVECELGLREPELYDREPTDEAMEACTRKTRALIAVDKELA